MNVPTQPASEATASPHPSARAAIAGVVLVMAVTAATFFPSLANGFVNWDDDIYVTTNQFIRDVDGELFRTAFFERYFNTWHPLTWISHAVDYQVWGLNPLGHHLTSLLLHIVSAGVLFALLLRLLTPYPWRQATRTAVVACAAGALFWACHPLRVESVAWVSSRKDVLSGLFFLLAMHAWISFGAANVAQGAMSRRYLSKHFLLSLLFTALAVLSKPMAVTLPAVLLLLDAFALDRWRRANLLRLLIEKAPHALIAAVAALATATAAGIDREPAERIASAFVAPLQYLGQTLWPADLIPVEATLGRLEAPAAGVAVYALLLAMLFTAAVATRRRSRPFLPALLFYVVTLLPVLGIVSHRGQAVADRYTYVPGMALALLLAAVILQLPAKSRRVAPIFVAAWLGALTYGSWSYTHDWNDGISLWQRAARIHPTSLTVQRQLGNALLARERYAEARDAYARGLAHHPNDAGLLNNMAVALIELDDYPRAMMFATRSAALDSKGSGNALHTIGEIHLHEGRPGEALRYFQRALFLRPKDPSRLYNAGQANEQLGDTAAACLMYHRYLQVAPTERAEQEVRAHAQSLGCDAFR